MPPRKDQVERLAWQWAEATAPWQVSDEHVLTSYLLQPPHTRKTACRRNCRHQPLCVSGLGEQAWLQESDGTRLYRASTAEEQGPELRPEHLPAGLQNLGATCYVNSLLQLWFHNRDFRRAILAWEPYADPEERLNESLLTENYSPLTAIGHLQLIFGYMRGAMLRTVDPSPFILSLRLDTMYQQDAQEFSKLFSSLLEQGLSHQTLAEVRGAVQRIMRGQYEYVTRCTECLQESTCPSYFYELDLQIQGQKQLSDCLAEFLREESLTGANQYNCQACGGKRDASRAIRLKELPPMLNFQLMRFVFDRETGLKKKLSSQLRFPEQLDMSEHVRLPPGSFTYRLQAVLLHKGPSAYSGHYTAHICDSETGSWYRFNDEEVEKIKTLKLSAEDELEDGLKKPKAARCPKGYHSSSQAYMLVYGRSGAAAPATPSAHAQSELAPLPDHIQLMVDRQNAGVTAQLHSSRRAQDISVEEYRCREREVRHIYPGLACSDVSSGLMLLPLSWLSAWLAGQNPGPVDMTPLHCRHGKLSPWHAAKTKCVRPSTGELLVCIYGGAGMDASALCRDCVRNRCRAIRAKLQLEEDARTVAALLKEDIHPGEPAVWIGKETLRVWRRLALATLPQDSPPPAPKAVTPASDASGPASPTAVATADVGRQHGENGTSSATRHEEGKTGDGEQRSTAPNGPVSETVGEGKWEDGEGIAPGNGAVGRRTDASVTGKGVKCEGASGTVRQRDQREVVSGVDWGPPPSVKNEENAYVTSSVEHMDTVNRRDETKEDASNGDADTKIVTEPPEDGTAVSSWKTRASMKRPASPGQAGRLPKALSTGDEHSDVLQRPTLVPEATPISALTAMSVAAASNSKTCVVNDVCASSEASSENSRPKTNGLGSKGASVPSSSVSEQHSNGHLKPEDTSASASKPCANTSLSSSCTPSVVPPSSGPNPSTASTAPSSDLTASATSLATHLSSNSASSMAANATPSSTSLITHLSLGSFNAGGSGSHCDQDAGYEPGTVNTDSSDGSSDRQDRDSDGGEGGAAVRTADRDGQRNATSTETEDTSANDEEEDEEFNVDILCPHGELGVDETARRLVPEAVWSILTKYFPDAKEYSQHRRLCAQCQDQASEEQQMRLLYRQLALEQRAALSDLYSGRGRPQVAAPACPPGRYRAISKHGTTLWRKFLKDPDRRDPATLESRSLMCCHGGLLYSPRVADDLSRVVFLHDWEWELVKRSGHDGHEVVVTKSEGDPNLTSTPEPCEDCMRRRAAEERRQQLQYTSTTIFIRKVDSLEEEIEEMASRGAASSAPGGEPVRRSSRPRRARGDKQLTISSTDTLRDLKVQIMKAFKVAPYDQHLMFNGCRLEDGLATLGHLGIAPGSTLLLKVDEECDAVDTTVSEDLTAAANPEMGFKGTGLVSS